MDARAWDLKGPIAQLVAHGALTRVTLVRTRVRPHCIKGTFLVVFHKGKVCQRPGIEPGTPGSEVQCSTSELRWL